LPLQVAVSQIQDLEVFEVVELLGNCMQPFFCISGAVRNSCDAVAP
jgi:hypothetical protein